MTRAEHLKWAKERALEYVEAGDLHNAFASMMSDLSKHEELRDHAGIELGMMQMVVGQMSTAEDTRRWIEGFN